MKKFLKSIIIIAIIIVLICLVIKLDILDFSFLDISEERLSEYSSYYYSKLSLDEQKMYVRIDDSVKAKNKKVFLGLEKNAKSTEDIIKVITAYFYDNPEYFYISNEYLITTRDFKFFRYSLIELDYIIQNEYEIELKTRELERAVENFLSNYIKSGMTNYEKEVAIHDALVKEVDYYDYEDINSIPKIKHTAYAALVEKEAVCDGYSRALKMLLEKEGIESIIITGNTESVAHAWNLVKLENEYYHVDVTSNKIVENNKKLIIHRYFNVTDEVIAKTHIIDDTFEIPECRTSKYDYYANEGFFISYEDNLYNRLQKIIKAQKSSPILEFKVDIRYTSRSIIDQLYDLDFNNWSTNGKRRVEYNKIDDVYIFIK